MDGWRPRTGLRVAALGLVLAACSAAHAAPMATMPPPPSTAAPRRATVVLPDDEAPVEAATGIPESTLAPSTLPPSTIAPAAWATFDEALANRLIGGGDYAAGVAVAVRGEIVHAADFGYRVPPPSPPSTVPGTVSVAPATTAAPTVPSAAPEAIEPGDRFRIASISKVITAIVVLQLVEGGQLGLDDPVGGRLAELVGATVTDPAVAGITVRQLLSHTSGFPEYESTFFRGHVDSCPAAGQVGLSRSLLAPPGTRYIYSNLNFCLLGLLVEQVAGRPYEAVVTDRLLAPLGIEGMRLATTYDTDPAAVVHPSAPARNYMEVLGAAGSWVATPSDIVRIVASLDTADPGFHPLSQAMVDLMRAPVSLTAPAEPGRGYGLGMMVFGDGTFGHTGTVENTHAMVLDRSDGVTWSVLVSGEYPWTTLDLRRIFDRSLADAGIALP